MPLDVVRRLGVVPSYYLRYYYAHDEVLREQLAEPSRAEQVSAMESDLLKMYADPALTEKPALLDKRGGAYYSEAAVQLVHALTADTGEVRVANVRNNGTLPFLPDEAVIEVPARIGAHGATPLPVAAVEPLFSGLISHVTAYEELALDAALHGGVERVATALLAHPLVGQVSVAEELAGRLVAANRAHLWWAR
jgi:6-phospho-beta-glucosidase